MRPELWLQNSPLSLPSSRPPAWLRAAPSFAVPSRGERCPRGGLQGCAAPPPHERPGAGGRHTEGFSDVWTPRLSCRVAPSCCSGAGLRCGRSLSRTPPHSQLLPAGAPGTRPGSPPGPRGARTCPGVVTRVTLTKHPARRSYPRRITTRPPGRSSWPQPREPGRESSLPGSERPQHRREFGSRSPAPTRAARWGTPPPGFSLARRRVTSSKWAPGNDISTRGGASLPLKGDAPRFTWQVLQCPLLQSSGCGYCPSTSFELFF